LTSTDHLVFVFVFDTRGCRFTAGSVSQCNVKLLIAHWSICPTVALLFDEILKIDTMHSVLGE